jgi:hypothetical protein
MSEMRWADTTTDEEDHVEDRRQLPPSGLNDDSIPVVNPKQVREHFIRLLSNYEIPLLTT